MRSAAGSDGKVEVAYRAVAQCITGTTAQRIVEREAQAARCG